MCEGKKWAFNNRNSTVFIFCRFLKSCLVPTNPPHKFTGDERNFENRGDQKYKDSDTKMTKAVDGLTFPMSRVSESASRLKTIISDMLPRFTDDYSDDLSVRHLLLFIFIFLFVLETILRCLVRFPWFLLVSSCTHSSLLAEVTLSSSSL